MLLGGAYEWNIHSAHKKKNPFGLLTRTSCYFVFQFYKFWIKGDGHTFYLVPLIIGLEEARGLCLDRDAWRSMIDKAWAMPRFRRRTKGDRAPLAGLRWKQRSPVGGPSCVTRPYEVQKWLRPVGLYLSWIIKEWVSGCEEWMWVWMDFWFLFFFLLLYPLQRGYHYPLWKTYHYNCHGISPPIH